jgi:hypothetical protein
MHALTTYLYYEVFDGECLVIKEDAYFTLHQSDPHNDQEISCRLYVRCAPDSSFGLELHHDPFNPEIDTLLVSHGGTNLKVESYGWLSLPLTRNDAALVHKLAEAFRHDIVGKPIPSPYVPDWNGEYAKLADALENFACQMEHMFQPDFVYQDNPPDLGATSVESNQCP